MTTYDDLLHQIGEFGCFQKKVFLITCTLGFILCPIYTGIVFLGFTPEHWCSIPGVAELSKTCGWSLTEEKNYTIPTVSSGQSFTYSQCQRYDIKWNSTESDCFNPLSQFTNYSTSLSVTGCEDGWIFNGSGSTIATEFNLVCADAWKVDMFQSCLSTGFLAGSVVLGNLSDRFGRKLIFILSVFVTSVSGVLLAAAPSYPWLLVFRISQGLFSKAGWTVLYVLMTELVGSHYRRTVGALTQMGFSFGLFAVPAAAYFIREWRWLQFAFSAPYFFFLLTYWFLPESPRWLLSQNRNTEAMNVAEKIAKGNGTKLTTKVQNLKINNEEKECTRPPSFGSLIRTPQIRKHTLILMVNWFTSSVVYGGLVLRLGILGGNIYLDYVIAAVVELPTAVLIYIVIDRVGRRLPFAVSNLVAGIACLITAFVPEDLKWLKTCMALIGRLAITSGFELVCLVNAELYPTFIRNLGLSVCSAFSDIGGIISPFILYRLAAVWFELPLIVYGVMGLIAGGLAFLLPETKGRTLPETIEDIENMHRYDMKMKKFDCSVFNFRS
ncbi:solute carrier family 22 member 2 [Protopterus annectens]|uniref:solute carrier family 22 member 2 n=1 Tax=Protopterus annectens TaxID=7888 RepID=UPI001CFBDAA7|nr:solute carrier family 22 member 2 [Protopterus annectens]